MAEASLFAEAEHEHVGERAASASSLQAASRCWAAEGQLRALDTVLAQQRDGRAQAGQATARIDGVAQQFGHHAHEARACIQRLRGGIAGQAPGHGLVDAVVAEAQHVE